MTTTLGVIPARGGSKGVPRKNLIEVGGRTLLDRAVTALRGSGVVDRVVVSTDDAEIAQEARRAGAEVPFMRPAELARDDVSIMPVIEHAIGEFEAFAGETVNVLVFTEPTVPFRTARHVAEAVERYRAGGCRSVISVCPLERKPHNIFVKTASRTLAPFIEKPKVNFVQRQDMAHLCRLSSGVYVLGRDDFMAAKALIVEPVGYTEMTGPESVNIDEEIDVLIAEAVAARFGW